MEVLKPLREFILPTIADHNASTIYYTELIDENADSEETMTHVAEMVIEKVQSDSQRWIVLVGDGKTYDHLLKVKRLYGSDLGKLIIFPGDWHVLKNFQPVLMKAYYHAGLKDIAIASGYRAETLKSLDTCSHFKRTHSFLMQVWEALYIEMISSFMNTCTNPQFENLQASIKTTFDAKLTPQDHLLSVQGLVKETLALDAFNKFVTLQTEADDTWKFWSNFVLVA